MIIMAIYSLLMAAFIISRVILPLKLRKVWKLALSLFIMAACCKNQITHLLGGPMFFAPDLPGWFLLPAAWVYASAFLLFCGLVVMEIIRLAVKLVYFCRKQRKLPEKTVMIFQKTKIQGVFHIFIETLQDERGFFARQFCEKEFGRKI